MDGALHSWKQHRTDYRIPALLSVLLWLVVLASGSLDWLRPHAQAPTLRSQVTPILDTGPDGIQLIEVALPEAPAAPLAAVEAVVYEIGEAGSAPTEEGSSSNDESWSFDPTRAHALIEELFAPADPGSATKLPPPSLTSILSLNGVTNYALADTSHYAVAQAGFSFTQRGIIARNRPAWAQQHWEEQMRSFWHKVIMDDPLRGPQ